MALRVMFCGTGWTDFVPCISRALAEAGIDAEVKARDPALPLAEQLAGFSPDVALPSNAPFGPSEIAAAPRLRLIQQCAVGFEGIDLRSARAAGLPVCNAPGVNTEAVAEAALFLILALARRLRGAERAFARATIGSPLGFELAGRRLGIVGLGKTGSRLAKAAAALGMTTSGVQSRDDRGALLEMLRSSDVVSIHCPLTPRTRGLFDQEAFAALPRGALLVNVARGPIVDRAALEGALTAGHLGGAGLDVFWEEPWNPNDPLFARENVIPMPHIAGSTEQAFSRIAAIVARNIRAMASGEPLVHRVDGG